MLIFEDEVGTTTLIKEKVVSFLSGQHAALQAIQNQLLEGRRLFAFLDDIHVVTTPERVGDVSSTFATALFIQINDGKTRT